MIQDPRNLLAALRLQPLRHKNTAFHIFLNYKIYDKPQEVIQCLQCCSYNKTVVSGMTLRQPSAQQNASLL